MAYRMLEPRFPLGRIYATPGAIALGVDLGAYLRRHHCGDWGEEPCEEECEPNESAPPCRARILCCFRTPARERTSITPAWKPTSPIV